MIFTIVNLKAGLDTYAFAERSMDRYYKAVDNYKKAVENGTDPKIAIDNELAGAINGLANDDNRLQTAREAAGIFLQNNAQTAATSIIGEPVTEDKPWFRTTLEQQERNKTKTLKDPDAAVKARKSTMLLWIIIGIFMGFAFSYVATDIASSTAVIDWSLWFWIFFIFVCPLSVVFFGSIGYRKAIRPRSTDAVEDEAIAQSSAQHTTQASGGHA